MPHFNRGIMIAQQPLYHLLFGIGISKLFFTYFCTFIDEPKFDM